MIDEKKVFIIKKGQEDWRVWNRVNDWLNKLMTRRRRSHFKERILRKEVKIVVTITDKQSKQ